MGGTIPRVYYARVYYAQGVLCPRCTMPRVYIRHWVYLRVYLRHWVYLRVSLSVVYLRVSLSVVYPSNLSGLGECCRFTSRV